MTNRERVLAAISHRETDIIPYDVGFTQQEYDKVAEYLGDRNFGEKINNHMSGVYYDGWPKEMAPGTGYFKDDFGVVWNRNGIDKDIGVINGLVLKEPTLKGYTFPEPDEAELKKRFDRLMKEKKNNFTFGNLGFSMFERAWSMRGMENLLMDMVIHPNFVDELLDLITEYNLKIIDIGLEYDVDGFMFGDDWGQQRGLIMGPKHWRRFIKPRMARMYERVKSKGKVVLQHSCGDIHEIFPDLIEIGLDVYQTFQPEIYDIKKMKKEYGAYLTFWGGISTQRLLPFASAEEVKRVTRETLDILGVNGGYIAGPTHSIPGDVPPENVLAMLEVLENQ